MLPKNEEKKKKRKKKTFLCPVPVGMSNKCVIWAEFSNTERRANELEQTWRTIINPSEWPTQHDTEINPSQNRTPIIPTNVVK